MTRYVWTLSLHAGTETFTGNVWATNQRAADEMALLDALGDADDHVPEPDSREPGVMRWAGQAGATILTVVEAGSP